MLQAPSLAILEGVRHGFFDRTGGVSKGLYATLNGGVGSNDAAENVVENRARMATALGVAADRLVTPYQVHSADVVAVDAPWNAGDRPHADALVTRTPMLAIGVSTADCGPLLFADPEARVIGAAHAGWRGAFTGVIEATVGAMETLGAERGRIVAVLGPTISQANYQVGPEFIERFLVADTDNDRFFVASEREGYGMFDLNGYIALRARRAGIGSFEDVALCTYSHPDHFYSFRRSTHRSEPDYGRHINAIVLGE